MDETTVSTELKLEGGKATEVFSGHPAINVSGLMAVAERPDAWDPPHMLVAAVEACFYLTLDHIAKKSRVEIAGYSSAADGAFGSFDGKHHEFSEIVLRPKIALKDEADRAKLPQLIRMAEEHCPVARSLKISVKVETQ